MSEETEKAFLRGMAFFANPSDAAEENVRLRAEVERLTNENNAFRNGLHPDVVSYVLSRVPTKEG